MLVANLIIIALDPKVELDAETLVLHSGSKFLCFLVHFFYVLLILVPNRNCVRKSLYSDLASLTNHISYLVSGLIKNVKKPSLSIFSGDSKKY